MFADRSASSTPSCSFMVRSKCTNAIETPEDIDQDEILLRQKCAMRRHLDGRYFEVDFARSSLRGKIVAQCKLCDSLKKSISGVLRTQSNFTSHMKRIHKTRFDEYLKYIERKLPRYPKKLATSNDPQKIFEENVTRFILNGGLPFSIVELPSFRKLINDLPLKKRIKLQHLSKTELYKQLTTTYNRKMRLLRKKLSAVDRVCTTADIWMNDTERFFCVTVHWIDPETFERNSAAIACRRIRESSSPQHLGKMIDKIHAFFELDAVKIVATITDSGSCFAEAYRELQIGMPSGFFSENELEDFRRENKDRSLSKRGKTSSVPIDEEHDQESSPTPGFIPEFRSTFTLSRHFHCICRSLNLIATTDVSTALRSSSVLYSLHQQSLERCDRMWKILEDPKNRARLTEALGMEFMNSISERPSSAFRLFDRVLELKLKLTASCVILGIENPISDLTYIEEYSKCLRIVATSIEELQVATNSTYGYVLPTLVSLRKQLMQLSEKHQFLYCRSLINALITSVDTRFADYFNIRGVGYSAAVAAIVHPNFKTKWMSDLHEEARQSAWDAVARAARSVSTTRSLQSDADAEMQLTRYINERSSDNFSVGDYPVIKKMFLHYNAPLAGSTPVECLFSQATMRNAPRLSRLPNEEFERRILSACNAKVWRQNFELGSTWVPRHD